MYLCWFVFAVFKFIIWIHGKFIADYECQVGILECLFRMIPRKQRREYASDFFHSQNILDRFMLIKDAQFETVSIWFSIIYFLWQGRQLLHFQNKVTYINVFQDCRIFLNEYNASIPNQLWVGRNFHLFLSNCTKVNFNCCTMYIVILSNQMFSLYLQCLFHPMYSCCIRQQRGNYRSNWFCFAFTISWI